MFGIFKKAPSPRIIRILVLWDEDAGVWVAQSKDVPGLAIEAATMEDMQSRVIEVVPELLALNSGIDPCEKKVPLELLMRGRHTIPMSC